MDGPAPPPPERDGRRASAVKPTLAEAFAMLSAVVAASIPGVAYRSLRQAVAITIPRTGNQSAKNTALWRAMMPKGILHDTLLQPATQTLRALANAPSHAKCFMFKPGQCPSMIHPDTVFMLTLKGWMFVAFTISYVTGKVGCSKHYESHYNRVCRGWECYVDYHHISTRIFHFGFCFVEPGINQLISAIVSPSAPSGCKIDPNYSAFPPEQCLQKLWDLKNYERRLVLETVVDPLECDRDQQSSGDNYPSSLLIWSLLPGEKNDDFLEPADAEHLASAGLGRRAPEVFQFKPDRRPGYVDESCVLQRHWDDFNRRQGMRLLHGRCPILGIGGTKVEGHNTWPLVLHHIQYDQPGTPYSLSSFCHHGVNIGIDCLPD